MNEDYRTERAYPSHRTAVPNPKQDTTLAVHLLRDLQAGMRDTPDGDIAKDLQRAIDNDLTRIIGLLGGDDDY